MPCLSQRLYGARARLMRVDRVAVEQLAVAAGRRRSSRPGRACPWPRSSASATVEHAGFGGDHEMPVARAQPARRAQAVAVERAGGVAAVDGDDAGRAVPGLGVERVVLVERGEVGVLVFQRLRSPAGSGCASPCSRSMPPACSSSSMLSSDLRVRAVGGDHRIELARGPARGVRQACARACAQARLPAMVLISPLCASRRNGCASGQRGAVLVEKRWWKTTALLARSARAGRDRAAPAASGSTMPL